MNIHVLLSAGHDPMASIVVTFLTLAFIGIYISLKSKGGKNENAVPVNESNDTWIEKRSEAASFYLSYPATPTYTTKVASAFKFHGWNAKVKNGQVNYFMTCIEVLNSEEVSRDSAEKRIPSLMDETDIQVSKVYLTYSDSNAIDFLYKTSQTPILYKKGRIIVRNQKFYILQIFYNNSEDIDFERFANSLRFY